MTISFITGITGQDGSYLAERLVAEGHEVHGLVRSDEPRTAGLPEGVVLHRGDLQQADRVVDLVRSIAPHEIYNLGGLTSVALSWSRPGLAARVSGSAVADLLEAATAVRETAGHEVRFVQASSAEIFGRPSQVPQVESTLVAPISPYGAAKAFAHRMVQISRERGLLATNCVLYNHESPRRPETFVTRKITSAAARIARDGGGTVSLGNLDVERDWGWAPDYVDAMVRAARHDVAGDYVIATGQAHSVAEFVEAAFARVGLGEAWRDHVVIDPQFFRPNDAPSLVGDPTRAREVLGWQPTVGFAELVGRMVDSDLGR